eukprot:Hpha_TRINITY_DN11316_c0_g1::TRINITY_DN11316_c0_g1_i1::g.62971::m.62971
MLRRAGGLCPRVAAGSPGLAQKRGFRYRGQSDVDTQTMYYWMPMESPNYSGLPEHWDQYMWHGFGQEVFRYMMNTGGEHDRMGRKYTKVSNVLYGYIYTWLLLWLWTKIYYFFRPEEEYFYNMRLYDFPKKPFDNLYLHQWMSDAKDPMFIEHINSTSTY